MKGFIMPYSFTMEHPPLLKDGDVFNVDPASLKGPSTVSTPPATGRQVDDNHDHYQYQYSYHIERYYKWTLVPPVHHYSEDQSLEVVNQVGYDKSEKDAMERNLSATAGGAAFGFSASITADLKLDQETLQSWHESTETKTTMKFSGQTTYATWHLYDVIVATVTTKTNYEWKGADPPDPHWTQRGVDTVTYLHVVEKQFDDVLADPAGSAAAAINGRMAAMMQIH
jgi:hypothetical protein